MMPSGAIRNESHLTKPGLIFNHERITKRKAQSAMHVAGFVHAAYLPLP